MTNRKEHQHANSVIEARGPISSGLPPEQASRRTVNVLAYTDVIGGSWMSTKYATELLAVDPEAPLEEGCLAVIRFNSGSMFMTRYASCGHDANGRFCKRGSPEEMVCFGPIYMRRKQMNDELIQLIGRVVGCDREFPRPAPTTYEAPRRGRAGI